MVGGTAAGWVSPRDTHPPARGFRLTPGGEGYPEPPVKLFLSALCGRKLWASFDWRGVRPPHLHPSHHPQGFGDPPQCWLRAARAAGLLAASVDARHAASQPLTSLMISVPPRGVSGRQLLPSEQQTHFHCVNFLNPWLPFRQSYGRMVLRMTSPCDNRWSRTRRRGNVRGVTVLCSPKPFSSCELFDLADPSSMQIIDTHWDRPVCVHSQRRQHEDVGSLQVQGAVQQEGVQVAGVHELGSGGKAVPPSLAPN